ncbi:MAG: type I-C CRISPR-associated protein Cas8c/Csd1 [Verrucomicrobiae bacterium]|nr:type I-C CRISPR-associated protein Cas8c/Csd1 [Verrucomicrobiae bacterium]
MLLKHLYEFAQSRKLLDDLAFSPKAVRWILELDASGQLRGGGPQMTGDDKRGKEFICPQTTRPKVVGGVSEFLADGLTAVFGLDPDPDAPMPEAKRASRDTNNAAKEADFWRQIEDAAKDSAHPGLQALMAFRDSLPGLIPQLLRWGTAPDAKSGAKCAWWLRTANGDEARLGPENFTFRVSGELLLENETIRQFWRGQHAREVDDARSGYSRGLCLVSARENQPLAPTHNPKIKGVPNTQSFGAAIVSFDKPAFGSYGFDQSLNAPTSEEAATAYCVALNWMLGQDEHSSRLGQTSFCFWARETAAAGSLFARLLNRPDSQSVAQFLKSPWSGIQRELARKDEFFAVTLAGNSGRIVVRHWLQEPLDQAIEHFHHWFADLELKVPQRPTSKGSKKATASGKKTEYHPLSAYWLACTTVREAKDLAPDVPAQLYRAALEGTAPSASLIKPILDQLHSKLVRDEDYQLLYDQSRFALLKLILNRNRNHADMEIGPELTADTDDAAYNCGRLLAILSATQSKAHEYKLEGSGVAERYFGTASVSPASVFPLLLRLNRHHLNKIRKSERFGGHERFIEEQMQGVLALFKPAEPGLPPVFPRTLDLQAQGRFALGFYQQQAAEAAARQAARGQQSNSESQ